jgi:hypothetical protein
MDREEMISFIIEGELKMMDTFKKGHKPHIVCKAWMDISGPTLEIPID